jgi:RNA polymerase sigma-70 factor (ECF subfamily)
MSWLWPTSASVSEAEWEALYARELPRIYNFFRYRVGDGPVAEDLTSTTFEKAWRSRARYDRDLAKFSTWVFAIARNVAVDHYRRSRPLVPIDEAADRPASGSPEEEAVRRSDFERLSALLAGLSDRERELLALKFGAELSNREIARATGLGESNVGTIIHRAVAALRAKW